jgi:hypothetical protein
MGHRRANDERCIGFGLEFDCGAGRREGYEFALSRLVRDQNHT